MRKRPETAFATRQGLDLAALPGVDQRTAGGRRYREVCRELAQHVGGAPSAVEAAMIRRAAALQMWCETAEAALASGGDLDVQAFATATNTLRRILLDFGLQSRPRDVTPVADLSTYLRAKGAGDG